MAKKQRRVVPDGPSILDLVPADMIWEIGRQGGQCVVRKLLMTSKGTAAAVQALRKLRMAHSYFYYMGGFRDLAATGELSVTKKDGARLAFTAFDGTQPGILKKPKYLPTFMFIDLLAGAYRFGHRGNIRALHSVVVVKAVEVGIQVAVLKRCDVAIFNIWRTHFDQPVKPSLGYEDLFRLFRNRPSRRVLDFILEHCERPRDQALIEALISAGSPRLMVHPGVPPLSALGEHDIPYALGMINRVDALCAMLDWLHQQDIVGGVRVAQLFQNLIGLPDLRAECQLLRWLHTERQWFGDQSVELRHLMDVPCYHNRFAVAPLADQLAALDCYKDVFGDGFELPYYHPVYMKPFNVELLRGVIDRGLFSLQYFSGDWDRPGPSIEWYQLLVKAGCELGAINLCHAIAGGNRALVDFIITHRTQRHPEQPWYVGEGVDTDRLLVAVRQSKDLDFYIWFLQTYRLPL